MGRPLTYKTKEELEAKIEDYFAQCKPEYLLDDEGNIQTDRYGNPIYLRRNTPTVAGLAYYLGFIDRHALIHYQGRKAFCATILRAKLFIESQYEERLSDPSQKPQGAIFALKNLGWRDNIDVNQQGTEKIVFNVIPASQAPKETEDGDSEE